MAEKSGFIKQFKAATQNFLRIADTSRDGGGDKILHADGVFVQDQPTVSALLGSARQAARTRVEIYHKYHYMLGDPVINSALKMHVTAALGGNENTGEVVYIEALTDNVSPQMRKLAEEIKFDLEHVLNDIAMPVAFTGIGFGDSYARVRTKEGVGIVDIDTGEMVFPPLVQPYERGNRTEGFVIATGERYKEKLTIKQMVRLKMPRNLYLPQFRAIEKSLRAQMTNDDLDTLPLMPASAGGSFLEAAEEPYDNYSAAVRGMVGQRIMGSIDESIMTLNMDGMTKQQQESFLKAFKNILKGSKDYAEKCVKEGKYPTERRMNVLPVWQDKAMASIANFNATSGAQATSIEDVLFHAKLLAGALGTDLSMLGFSDLLSGGLGDGGFFRTSAQAAEKSRMIRIALTKFFNDLIDLHMLAKHGYVLDPADRPYSINFYGSISSLESERQATRERAASSSAMVLTALQQLKDLNIGTEASIAFLEKSMELDTDLAKALVAGMESAKEQITEHDQANDEGMEDEL